MNNTTKTNESTGVVVSRNLMLRLLTFSLAEGAIEFLGNASELWLSEFPGDLDVQLFSAYAQYASGDQKTAYQRVLGILLKNPEQYSAWLSMTHVISDAWGGVYALGGRLDEATEIPVWAAAVCELRSCLMEKQMEEAEALLESVLIHSGANPLVDVSHLRYSLESQDQDASSNLARLYQVRWPDCIQFKVVLANHALQSDDE